MSLPACFSRSTTTGRKASSSAPESLKNTFPSAAVTSSTRVSGQCPPANRKLAQRCEALKAALVSVPTPSSPCFSKPPIQYWPWWLLRMSMRRAETVSPFTG